jgi:para-nitrobenzyl esterase
MLRASLSILLPLSLLAGCSDDDPGAGGGGFGGGGVSGPLLIETDKGPVEGALIDKTRAFYAIPYAAPPVGDLRWKPPAPAAAWTEARDATVKSKQCAQLAVLTGEYDANSSEDCLFLNVWTPDEVASAPRPVMVWIHGGGFTLGSGSDPQYDGKVLSETTGAVVVNMNYRLGAFGYLAHPALAAEDSEHPSSGQYGIEDQRAALEWVKSNIAAFGGDPARVAVFGESAGGISTCFHLVSPLSEGLFSSAILESGPCDQAKSKADGEAQGSDLATALGCDTEADVPACLRGKTPAEIGQALPQGPFLFDGEGADWFPVIDGYNLPDDPPVMLANGDFAKVPVIVGANADEATIFFVLAGDEFAIETEADFELLADGILPGQGAAIVAEYPASEYETPQKAAEAAVGDAGFICASRRTAREISDNGGTAYLYHFSHAPAGALFAGMGSFHSAEVRYVFGTPGQLIPAPLDEAELELSKGIMAYWYELTAKGDPNYEGGVTWPKYEASSDAHIQLAMPISAGSGLKKDKCDFWDALYAAAAE